MLRAIIIVISALALSTGSLLQAAIVGASPQEAGQTQSLIIGLETAMEAGGIDVRPGNVTAESEQSIQRRPQLALLADLPSPPQTRAAEADGFAWLFIKSATMPKEGVTPFLVAVGDASSYTSPSLAEFKTLWNSAPPEKRLFLSFTSADQGDAQKVATALREKGFAVYTYLEAESGRVWTNSVEAAKFFREAGHRLVLDTPRARASQPIQIERAVSRHLERGEKLDAKGALVRVGTPEPDKEPCCQFCRESRVGSRGKSAVATKCEALLAGTPEIARTCGRVMCGVMCRGATN